MKRRTSSSDSENHKDCSQEGIYNIRTKPPQIYDNVTRRLLQLGKFCFDLYLKQTV